MAELERRMTLQEWVDSLPDDEREALSVYDAWSAGAQAMLEALIERGYISSEYADDARAATRDVVG